MANLALEAAASGLSSLNTRLDVIANNLANVNTIGFKQSRANFEDLLYVERSRPGTQNASGDEKPTGLYVGLGVRVSGTQVNFAQGTAIEGSPTDMMIDGNGFFMVEVEPGKGGDGVAYTRAGNFLRNPDGELVLANSQGRRLIPNITIPVNAKDISISSNGIVSYIEDGATAPTEVGPIEIAVFANPEGLKQAGENLFIETAGSGAATVGQPGTESFGSIIGGRYEASNVDPTRELIEMIRTQRAFEMNSQSIRAADQALQTVAQLRS
ncbi:MAG: flagellar basal-body rod protein FlgG [Phycisphaeraceae bacterium]|nr:flagellar basal-body rod protein FlgG [Phycisphaerales bacterium]MCB9859070.1 flagellar basal-body rod protein FlgG [Phycisphaeraceae bacterium]